MACCKAMVANEPLQKNDSSEVGRPSPTSQKPDPLSQTVYYPANIRREDLNIHSWAWYNNHVSNKARHTIFMTDDNLEVKFHPSYSSGTGVIRGDTQFVRDHDYYWEIKVLTQLYGTDVMIGVGTPNVDLTKQQFSFCSILGLDGESWGYSYNGTLHHDGSWKNYGPGFNKHSTIGLHLNMWEGTLSYFLNGKPLGVAFTSLKNYILYPMVSSTAAHSGIKLVYSYTCTSLLQQMCLRSLSTQANLMKIVATVPGLRLDVTKTFLNHKLVKAEEDIEEIVDRDECIVIVDSDDEYPSQSRSKRIKIKSSDEGETVNSKTGCLDCGANYMAYINSGRAAQSSTVLDTENTLCIVCSDII